MPERFHVIAVTPALQRLGAQVGDIIVDRAGKSPRIVLTRCLSDDADTALREALEGGSVAFLDEGTPSLARPHLSLC